MNFIKYDGSMYIFTETMFSINDKDKEYLIQFILNQFPLKLLNGMVIINIKYINF